MRRHSAPLLPGCAEERAPSKTGLILPYKGVWVTPIENIDRGFRVALAEFGNKVAGRTIEAVRGDDEMTPNVAVQKFNKPIQPNRVDVMGAIAIGVR
jgi:branched-chain amino acid transport system substrate-binding protein